MPDDCSVGARGIKRPKNSGNLTTSLPQKQRKGMEIHSWRYHSFPTRFREWLQPCTFLRMQGGSDPHARGDHDRRVDTRRPTEDHNLQSCDPPILGRILPQQGISRLQHGRSTQGSSDLISPVTRLRHFRINWHRNNIQCTAQSQAHSESVVSVRCWSSQMWMRPVSSLLPLRGINSIPMLIVFSNVSQSLQMKQVLGFKPRLIR